MISEPIPDQAAWRRLFCEVMAGYTLAEFGRFLARQIEPGRPPFSRQYVYRLRTGEEPITAPIARVLLEQANGSGARKTPALQELARILSVHEALQRLGPAPPGRPPPPVLSLEERFRREFGARAPDGTLLAFSATWLSWWSLCGAVQLACRHPGFTGPTRRLAEDLARQILAQLAPAGALAEVAERGWHAQFDEAAAPQTAGGEERAPGGGG